MNHFFEHITKQSITYGICIVFLSLCPMLILGKDAYILIHDNLDSEFLYRILTSRKNVIFNNSASIDQVMNGLPRTAFLSGFSVISGLFYFFKPIYAYLINEIIIHSVAFIGMFLLLRDYFLKEKNVPTMLIILGASLCFSFIPFYSIHGLTVPGQPLLLYAFLNLLYSKSTWVNWLIIIIFPFYSSFVLSFIFISTILFIIGGYFYIFLKIKSPIFFIGLTLFSILYLLIENGLIWSFLNINNSGFVSHRIEYTFPGVIESLKSLRYFLIETQDHTGFMYICLISLTLIISFCIKRGFKKIESFLLGTLLFTMGLTLLYTVIVSQWGMNFSILKQFNFGRFYFLLPTIWILIFAVSLHNIFIKTKSINHSFYRKSVKAFIIVALISQSIIILGYNKQFKNSVYRILGKTISEPTYRQFFASDVFSEIDDYISLPKNSYRVISIGMHPSIAQYNGFYTLDSYQNNYKLTYKHQFRQIIEKELEKDSTILNYFDSFGARCYAFVNGELDNNKFFRLGRGGIYNGDIKSLDFNWSIFKEMGGEYIFSSVEIVNFESLGLSFVKEFSSPESFWNIKVYQIK